MNRICIALLLAAVSATSAWADAVPQWIWLGEKSFPKQVVFFRKGFEVPGAVKKAALYATCDDEMIAFLNGARVLRSEVWQVPSYADVTNQVRQGRNVLAIRGKNRNAEIAGLLVKLVIETKDGRKLVVTSDGTWSASEKARKGWNRPSFDDSKWSRATVLGKLGDGPWTVVNARSLTLAATQQGTPPTYSKLRSLKDFHVETVYTVPPGQGSWVSMTTDPKGRLIVSDQYGKLYRVTPPPISSKEKATVEELEVPIGEAQGLLWAFDSLYVVVNRGGRYRSGLYRVKDTDGDDRLDKVELLRELQGAGEHGPHAVILSPDGKSLFVCCGNHTNMTRVSASRVPMIWGEDSLLPRLWDASGHAVGRKAPAGCIYQVTPDGKQWTLWSMGFRNEYDIAFNRFGELFTYDSDMEWDMNTPWYRPTRVCHCVSGSEFGWRGGTAKYPVYYPDNLPPVVDIGPGSPTGVVFGYGAKFPKKYQEALYICDWSYGKLYAVHLEQDGATYKGTAEEFVTGTPLPLTDIVVRRQDGAIYFTVGGRRVKSALYRIVYTGKEPTDPVPAEATVPPAIAERRKLERYHGKGHDPKTVIPAAWPYLGHKDRFLRWAARTALEHLPPQTWAEKALAERNPQASLEAIIGIVRAWKRNDRSFQPKVLAALDRLEWKELSEAQRFALLRAYGLTFIRLGPPEDDVRQRLIAKFDPLFPADRWEMNWELAKLLVYLQSPTIAAKAVKLMQEAPTQEEQMAYALALRNLEAGWTPELRKQYFQWFPKAFGYKGGNSFRGFVRNIRNEAVARLSPKEKQALKPILEAQPVTEPVPVAPPRKFVKEWTVAEVMDLLKKRGLKGRDYNRGRRMFGAVRCFACHRFAGEGGSTGPDLTGVAGRFSPEDLVTSIIEPSKTISDQYQAVTILLKDGRVVHGRIVNLAGDSLRVNTDMFDPNKLVGVNRRQIEAMSPSSTSMMPKGLINSLNEEEILDLLAFLLSRGDRNAPMFQAARKE